jgi:hypothetical protein
MVKKIIISAAGLLALITATALGIHFYTGSGLEGAISDFENRSYQSSIVKLNALIPLSGYEDSEKIYYYRARALNGLAEELENDYSDELKEAILGREETKEFQKARDKISRSLEKINKKTDGDLTLVLNRPASNIVPRGKFYDEFVAKYRGSSLIEDLDFEQLKKIEKTQEGDKPVRSITAFYEKYPNTGYVAQLVKMLFSQLQKGNPKMGEQGKVVFDIIISYGRRYPTSPEINLIYTCTGDGVNLRNSPGVNGQRVGSIPSSSVLLQLEKSMDTSQVGDVRDYWYRVADLTGQQGWIFGKFMKPFNISDYQQEETGEKWTLNEDFADWVDSNTPSSWTQVDDSGKGFISFVNRGTMRVALVSAGKEKRSGIFTRYNASRAFTILCRARYIEGDALTIFAYAFGDGTVYSVTLKAEEVNVCGRTIPLHTSDWHDYRLSSDDGRFATLSVDGEVLSGRITAVRKNQFPMRGIYALYSEQGETSSGEVQFIRAR